MTKKQMETLYIMIDICHTPEEVVKKYNEIRAFLISAWELYFWGGDYSKCTKAIDEIGKHACEKITAMTKAA